MSLHQLSKETVHLLSSSQVITSVYAVVKELVENSLDAKATSIEVKLENFGLNAIEVRDNGTGIKREDTANMARPHFTSKLSSFQDLQSLEQYGFRGEALTSVAAVSDMSITTRTSDDDIATTYMLDHSGNVASRKPSHLGLGTTVSVTNLFKNLPVRKQCFKSAKRCKEELRRIEDLMIGFGLAHCALRLTLKHNRCIIWQKIQTSDFGSNVSLIFGAALFQQLTPVNHQSFSPMIKIRSFVPKPEAEVSVVSRSTPDKIYVLVNERCVILKQLNQLLKQMFTEAFPSQSGRYPVAVVMISVPPADVDVNFEPNKTSVLLHNMDFILATMESLLTKMYTPCKLSAADKEVPTGGRTCEKEERASTDTHTTGRQPQRTKEVRHTEKVERGTGAPPTHTEAPPTFTGSLNFITEERPSSLLTFQGGSREVTHDERATNQPQRFNKVLATHDCSFQSEMDSDYPVRGQRSSSDNQENSHFQISRQELETFELLDISEFENDSSDSLPEGTLQAPPPLATPPKTTPPISSTHERETEERDSDIQNFQAPPTSTPSFTAAKSTRDGDTSGPNSAIQFNQMSLSQWSRGEALRDSCGQPIEPVKVLTTAAHGQHTEQGMPPAHSCSPRLVSSQSKLNYKGPPPIFDMIHSRPVKRKADSSPSINPQRGGGEATSAKKHRPLPSLLQNLIQGQNDSNTAASNEDVVHKPTVDIPSQDLLFDFESISKRSDAKSCCMAGGDCTCVIGHVDPPGVWLVSVNGSIACFKAHTSSIGGDNPRSMLRHTDRKKVEQQLYSLQATSNSGYGDVSHYFHSLYKL